MNIDPSEQSEGVHQSVHSGLPLHERGCDMPIIKTFTVDEAVVAPCIYKGFPHETTPVGLVVERTVREELQAFLQQFIDFVGCEKGQFLRMDAFVSDAGLTVIEINVELQDGWGVALNLLRASGHTPVFGDGVRLPSEIIVYSEDYLPEFRLAQGEFKLLGHSIELPCWRERPSIPQKSEFDSKVYLAKFSDLWQGHHVRIPAMYWADKTPWEELPEDVVFKFCHKYGEQAVKARFSVATREQVGRGKFMRQCYADGHAIAQQRVATTSLEDGSRVQAIILASGQVPVTGYLQVESTGRFIINDRTARKGPLVLE